MAGNTSTPGATVTSRVLALLSALMGYAFIRTFWRINTVRQWQKRKEARACLAAGWPVSR